MASAKRAHILLPQELVGEIDAIVGPGKRSAFLVETARAEIRRRQLLQFLELESWLEGRHHPDWREVRLPGRGSRQEGKARSAAIEQHARQRTTRAGREMTFLLDTTILIDALRHRQGRRELLAKTIHQGHTLATTAINLAEIYAGMRPAEEARTQDVSRWPGVLSDYSYDRASCSGKLKWEWSRKGRTLALDDTLIAASALEHGLTMMVDNRMHFPMRELERTSCRRGAVFRRTSRNRFIGVD